MKFYIQKDKNPVKSHLAITPAQMDRAREHLRNMEKTLKLIETGGLKNMPKR